MSCNTFKNTQNPNLDYIIKTFSTQPYFSFDVDSEKMVFIQIQEVREFDVSEDENGKMLRKINCFIVADNFSREKWLFDKNTCLNKKEVPDYVKKTFDEFRLLIPTF